MTSCHCCEQVHTRKLKLDEDVTDDVLRQVARDLPGLSGACLCRASLQGTSESTIPSRSCSVPSGVVCSLFKNAAGLMAVWVNRR